MGQNQWFALAFCAVLLGAAPGGAQSIEWREPFGGVGEQPGVFQDKCGRCHDRAGPLVRERLTLTDDGLVSKATGRDLRAILPKHFGRRGEDEVAAIYRELLRVARGRGWFEVRCGVCHESAEDLARHALILRDGALAGRYTGRDIADFLRRHGTDSAEEAAFFEGVLRRQVRALE